MRILIIISILLFIFILLGFVSRKLLPNPKNYKHSNTDKILSHLNHIIETEKPRNYQNIESLNQVASYIFDEFDQYSDDTYFQKFDVEGQEYKNVVAVFGAENKKTIVIGAHYDVCGNQDGADDNASGVVGLLELARLFHGKQLKYRIEIVAYTLEEPPFFKTEFMGSYIHAKSLKDKNIDVYGMVCLEMIGYFDERPHSQEYPLGFLRWIYGNTGDFIALVNKIGKGRFASKFIRLFKHNKTIKTKKITAPKSLQGLDFSDHLNYWKFGFSAVMITDTAFFRNKNYHESTDRIETLDIEKMGKVIDGVFLSVLGM